MGVFYESIPPSLREWILQQNLFWVASAPLSGGGHVNVSPKGGKYFGILDESTFWYMDLTGSGSETISHLHERGNGRITIMFNAFEGAPKIVRLWGRGQVLELGTPPFDDFIAEHRVETLPGTRSIIIVDIHQVGSSCGFSVPFYHFKEFRPTLNDHFAKLDAKYQKSGEVKDSMDHYWAYKNAWSVDGLPAMKRGQTMLKKHHVTPIKKMIGPLAPTRYQSGVSVPLQTVIMIVLIAFCFGVVAAVYAPQFLVYSGFASTQDLADSAAVNLTQMPSRWLGALIDSKR